MTEAEIAMINKRAGEGDPAAFRLIVSQNQAFLYTVAYRFLGIQQDAEDAVQETFIRLWKNLHKYKPEIKLTTWLYRIMVNHCLDVLKSSHRRQQKQHTDLKEQMNILQNQEADQSLHREELHKFIQEAASMLTPKQKAVFILRDLEGLPVEEVCEILSMSAGNVKSNLYYARQHMSEKLKGYYQLTDKVV